MRRTPLPRPVQVWPPPRPARRPAAHGGQGSPPDAAGAFRDPPAEGAAPSSPAAVLPPGIERTALSKPRPARRRLRRLFNPVTGWFRRLERRLSQELGNRIFPHLPGISWPYGVQLRRHLTLREGDIEVRGLPQALAGTSVLLITDIHTGPFLAPAVLEDAFRRLMVLKPDLVLLGGDIVTGKVEEFAPFVDAFRRLRAPLGTYAVLGNHDHYTGETTALIEQIESAGIEVLHDRSVPLRLRGEELRLAGIDDLHWGNPDLDAALAGCAGRPTLLLSHNPDVFFQAARRGVSLVLAGHTHGGQIRIPGLPVLVRMSRYRLDEGRYAGDGAQLVVSRGLGATGLPLRFACPPEAVLVRLQPPPQDAGHCTEK